MSYQINPICSARSPTNTGRVFGVDLVPRNGVLYQKTSNQVNLVLFIQKTIKSLRTTAVSTEGTLQTD